MTGTYLLREYGRLPYGDGPGEIPQDTARALCAAAAQSGLGGDDGRGILDARLDGLWARNIVGVVACAIGAVEILPKIDTPYGPENGGAVRRKLVEMLMVAEGLSINTGAVSGLDYNRDTLLDILIKLYCDKLTAILRRQMPRRYVTCEDDLPKLRGTLDVRRQFTHLAANPSRLASRFDELSHDIALNQIVKASLVHLSRITRRPALRQQLQTLGAAYADVTLPPVSALPWAQIVLDRTNRGWQNILAMARMFLTRHYQTATSGTLKATTLLFPMEKLFEAYITESLRRGLQGTPYHLRTQGGGLHCLTAPDTGKGLFRTRPDILVMSGKDVVHVIDTKWKRITNQIDDAKQGISQGDIYQLMAYAHLYQAPHLALLYPHHPALSGAEGIRSVHTITNTTGVLRSMSVRLDDLRQMPQRLREMVLTAQSAQSVA